MFERIRGAGTVLAGSLVLLLAACGGGGGGGSDDGSGGGGGGGNAKTCSEQFNADAAAANPDACQPAYNTQCDALGARPPVNASEPSPCTKGGTDGGVTTESFTAADTNYTVLKPATGGKKGIYVGLHWRGGNGATMANNMRLAELAKARDLTVVVPDSAHNIIDLVFGGALKDWDYDGAPAAIAAVIADVKARNGIGNNVPVVLAGVSSGAAGAARFFCALGNQLDGLLMVSAGEISGESSTACLSATASAAKAATSVPVTMIQGGRDPAYADAHANFDRFKVINGCSNVRTVTLNEQVDIEVSTTCTSDDGIAFVNVKDSGHNWPGMDRPIPSNPVTDYIPAGSSSGAMSIFGRVSYSFDATIQGYDLVRSLD
ncbi:hypothetical protein D0B54_02970 [Solimonas sp. K1W22B-7]|uniref:hypothetical protein n=1 Tax=Solimonas sp. K1W22B-7 TaxID=2303331 RepID=UPI000E333231|nr:hypothetical protein [Solimonas sp. K1W22B-7]AXQ27690.1 hypothetical protein D0B54_02970 [Solimonas sp. K1W22B-7]